MYAKGGAFLRLCWQTTVRPHGGTRRGETPSLRSTISGLINHEIVGVNWLFLQFTKVPAVNKVHEFCLQASRRHETFMNIHEQAHELITRTAGRFSSPWTWSPTARFMKDRAASEMPDRTGSLFQTHYVREAMPSLRKWRPECRAA